MLAGASWAALACWLPAPASAADLPAGTDQQLRDAIAAANASPDASSTITLTGNITVLSQLPAPNARDITIVTQGFTLSGVNNPSGAGGGIQFGATFPSGSLTITGTLVGGAGTGANGGVGLFVNSGNSSATGTMVINGTVTGGSGSGGGSGLQTSNAITVVNNGTITGGAGSTVTGGAGAQIGTGGTLINGGTIQGGTGPGGGAGVFLSTTTTGATLVNTGIIRGGDGAVGVRTTTGAVNTIANTGTIEGGAGAQAMFASSVGTDTILINSGTIRAGAGQANAIEFGSGAAAVTTLELQAGSLILGNVIAGAGTTDTLRLAGTGTAILDGGIGTSAQYRGFETFEKTGGGTWILTGENTVASPFQIQAGTLQIGNGGTTGSLAGDIANAGTLVFDRSDTLTHAGAISGTGGVQQSGSGTTILTGTNTYTGATTVTTGTLQLAAGGQVTATSSTTVQGTGTLTITGAGTQWQTVSLTLGNTGGSGTATLNVRDGAALVVTGALSQDTVAGPATGISVTGGGQVMTQSHQIGGGLTPTGQDSTVLVSGAGAAWTNIGTLMFHQGSMSVLDGGTYTTGSLQLGRAAGGTATLTVSGAGSAFASNGIVRLGNSSGGTGAITLADGGRLAGGGTFTLGSAAGATGVLNIGGAEGAPATAAGTLEMGSVAFGAGTGRINFNHTDAAYVFSPVISGNGAVNQTGPGTTILAGTNTYRGTTTISAGTLAITRDASLGDGSGTLAFNGGALRFDAGFDLSASWAIGINASGGIIDTNGFTTTIAQGITGAGGLAVTGGGTLILTGANLYAGGTAIDAGTGLQLGNGGTSGSIQGDVLDNGTLTFNRSDSVHFAGVIAGSGALVVTGGGTVILTGENSYTGGTTILSGTLRIGDGGTSGSILGDVRNDSPHTLVFDRSDTLLFPGAISGVGAVRQDGSGTTVLTGASTYTGGTTITAGTLQLGNGGSSGSILGDVTNNGTLAFNRADTLTFAGAISGTGGVRQDGSGVTVLAGANSYAGPTAVNAGTLRAGAAGAFSAASAFAVAAGATLDLAGLDQTVGGLTNAGLVTLGGAPGTRLTVAGSYLGQGGALALNTVLGGDGAATDRLVIQGGSATGSTGLRITNIGGAGAQTIEGIRVVEVANGGTTAAGAFRLDTRAVAGAFEYQLFRGGNASADDWYLRSFLLATPASPETPAAPESPGIPLYRPEVALYAPVAAIGRQMGLAMLGTLHARRGEEVEIPAAFALGKAGEGPGSGAWARVFGERRRDRWDGPAEARATANLIGMQAGFDILRTQAYAGGHRDVAGLYVAYADYNAPNVAGFAIGQEQQVGRLLMSGPAVGAYWTHYGPSGWYVDAVFQANWFDVSARSDLGVGLETNGTGYAASLEAGYPIRVGANWQIEPQAQVIWQGVSIGRARDAFSSVDWDEGDAVTGRIGARLQYTGRDERAVWQPYAKLNLWHAFAGTDRVRFDATPVDNRFGDAALEVGAGITARVSDSTSFYAHADYRRSLDGSRARESTTQGSIGIRVTW